MRRGRQEPRLRIEPSGRPAGDGGDACELIADACFEMDPWQADVLGAWLSRSDVDRYTYTTCGLAVPRQNGKNAVLEARELYGMVVCGEKVLHTSHLVRTSKKAFRHLASIFEDDAHPELGDMVTEVRRTNGEEMISLCNGGSIEYSARSRSSARGWTVDVVVFDEAQELTDDQIEAIVPAMSAAPSQNRQMIYTGTPPAPSSPGEVFARIRTAALELPDPRACWHEWGVDEVGDVADRDRWYEANPALGVRLTEDFCAQELRTMSEDGFARERLGWWSPRSAAAALPRDVWASSAVSADRVPARGRKTFGVKFSPDGSMVALAAVRAPDKGPAHCELVDARPLSDGTAWLADLLCTDKMVRTTAAVCVDGRNGTAPLMDALRRAYPRQAIVVPRARDVVDATSMTVAALREGKLTHWADEGQHLLDVSATGSVRRPVGSNGGWAFGGDDSAPIEAACLAYWASRTTKRNPGRGSRLL